MCDKSYLMRSINAEAVLKHRVRNEQTSGEKKSPSKGVLIFYFFPAHMQIFRPIGQSFGSRRERVNTASVGTELHLFLVHEPSILVQRCCNGNTVILYWRAGLFQSKLEIIIGVQ
jgi:hypothetical protein